MIHRQSGHSLTLVLHELINESRISDHKTQQCTHISVSYET